MKIGRIPGHICVAVLLFGLPISAAQQENASGSAGQRVVIENGFPTVKFMSGKGTEASVYFRRYGDEDAFAVNVYEWIKFNPYAVKTGWLYFTRNRVAFESDDDQKRNFKVSRTEIEKIEPTKWLNRHVLFIKTVDGKDKRFSVNFTPSSPPDVGFGEYHKLVLEFLARLGTAYDNVEMELKEPIAKLQLELRLAQERAKTAQQERELTKEEYEARFAYAVNHKKELLATISPEAILSTRAALKSLRKIAGATEIGVNFQEYGSRLIDVKAEVDEATSLLPHNAIRVELSLAVEAFVDAAQIWNLMRDPRYDFVLLMQSPIVPRIAERYSILIDRTGSNPVIRGRDQILAKIWQTASAHVERASTLLNQ